MSITRMLLLGVLAVGLTIGLGTGVWLYQLDAVGSAEQAIEQVAVPVLHDENVKQEPPADAIDLSALTDFSFELCPAGGGASLSFTDLTAQTKLVVYTWETDCPVCARQLPYVAKLSGELDPVVASLVSISVGNSEPETQEFASEHSLKFPVLWAFAGEFDAAYAEPGVPCCFVFDMQGELLGTVKDVEGQEFLNQVRQLLE